MRLKAVLTIGWPEPGPSPFAARQLHDAIQAEANYQSVLSSKLESGPQPPVILALEQLFRRRPGGFEKLKTFIGALSALPDPTTLPDSNTLQCEIDCFAYGFLKSAKNLDFLIPESRGESPYRKKLPEWEETIGALEELERRGEPLSQDQAKFKKSYLDLRKLLARKSARDERRSLVTLLVNGPSTYEDLRKDLGINESLSQRILSAFVGCDIVKRQAEERHVIEEEQLPVVIFCLRETLGVDPLHWLQPAEV